MCREFLVVVSGKISCKIQDGGRLKLKKLLAPQYYDNTVPGVPIQSLLPPPFNGKEKYSQIWWEGAGVILVLLKVSPSDSRFKMAAMMEELLASSHF